MSKVTDSLLSIVVPLYNEEDNVVLTLGEYSGTYRATGKSMRAPLVHVWRIENGKIQSFVQYTDTALVRAAMEND